ncbi:Citrinin biosynthesis cluster MFS transporter mrr1 [Colletotrichum sidae]|uniref:Citrinin biosynthesis cluster MFS transporter mrr1 n=1 Tax=Colletotrichum sidae TaxID=1347389 RepID=A0A4R8T7I6_9PEZI|nr:Citrinin biosynthesis cluster MFS transporter mrr1 [Colletotrichum sidae]
MLHDLLLELELLGTFEAAENSTLLAMNDNAFEYLANWGMNLSSIDPELARGIMKYHFLEGSFTSTNPLLAIETQLVHSVLRPPILTNVTDGAVVKLTAADNESPFRIECGIQKVLPVVEADIHYDSGVLHTIDENLVLPHNLSETTNLGNLDRFWRLVQKAQMSELLESLRDTTIMLPSNEAMEKYAVQLECLAPEDLRTTVNNHVITSRILYHTSFGASGPEVAAVSGLKLNLSRDSIGRLFVNNARVLKQDVLIYGGVSHVLDSVLLAKPASAFNVESDGLWRYMVSLRCFDEEASFETRVFEKIQGDDFIVDWSGPDDKGNAQNLPKPRKWLITWVLALYVLSTTFSSSVFSAAAAVTAKEYETTVQTMVFGGTSLFMLGFAIGPIIFGPLSERYGRKGPLVIGYVSFALLQLPAANAQNLFTIFASRFLQGVFGAAPSAILSGTLADIWTPKQRGFAMPCTGTFLMIGPVIGPMTGSVIVQSSFGWRGIFNFTAIFTLAIAAVTYPILTETYSPVLLAKRARRMRHMTRNWALRARSEEQDRNLKDVVENCLSRPAKMLVLEPILLLMSTYISVVFGLMYIFFLAYPMSFANERHWDSTSAGLPLLSILLGTIIGGALIILTVGTNLSPDPKAGRPQENRLLLMMLGSVCLPVGMFWFAATSSPETGATPQIIAGVPIGMGIILINMQGMNYIVDCYGPFSNSAISANTFMRSLFASGFPVFATSLYSSIGVARATSYLGLFGVVLAPIPFLLFKYGQDIRSKSKWAPS